MTKPLEPWRHQVGGRNISNSIGAPLYIVVRTPPGAVCCRCDEEISDAIAVNVPGLTARGWSHRTCLPEWLLA